MRKKFFLYFGCALIVGGALCLGWFWHFKLNMWRVQHATSWSLPDAKRNGTPHGLLILPPHMGEVIGRIEIPCLHLTAVVLEGTAPKILAVGAGHIKGTALPGAAGNVAIAAHRDTIFRALRRVQPRDVITVTTSYGIFRYVVDSTEIVDPYDVAVLHKTADPELTLVTCYPFTFVGSAPKRFIVHARQLSK